jgi:choline-glycine betaine transporter
MSNDPIQQELKIQLFGWILFVVCALLFLASSIHNRDTIAIYASLVFLVACFVFMIPLLKALSKKSDS